MNMIEKIKDKLKTNMRVTEALDTLWGAENRSRTRVLRRFTEEFRGIDSIGDFPAFQAKITELKKNEYGYYCSSSRYEDTRFYGYHDALAEYSGYKKRKYPIFTGIEHGIRFGEMLWPYFDYNTCYVCEGRERIREISDRDPWMPVFPVGPYIHYAKQYYSEERIAQEKKKNGRTLLVFPGHSCEWVEDTRENDIFSIVFDKYAGSFDTVMVCTYWRDADGDEVKRFQERGAKVVSAGFRADENFLRRLKTIISLADVVIGNDIGTNMGFAMYLKKPFILEGLCQVNPKDHLFSEYYRELYDAFALRGQEDFTEEQKRKQQEIYERFWGEKCIKTAEELYSLFALIDKMMRKARFDIRKYHAIIRQEVKENSILTAEEAGLLKSLLQAAGPGQAEESGK